MAIVRTYDGSAGTYLETWEDVSDIDLGYGEHGFTQGAVTVPCTSTHLQGSRVSPNGVAAFLEVDARADGVPEACVGYIESYSADSDQSGDVTVNIVGPPAWLGEETVTALQDRDGNPWSISSTVLAEHPNELWLRMGKGRDYGRGMQAVHLTGQSIVQLLDQMADDTGARYVITADGGGPRHTLNWGAPVRDRTGNVALYDSGPQANCSWTAPYVFKRQAGELALAIQSADRARTETVTARVRTSGHTVGVGTALAKLSDPYVTTEAASGQTTLRPDLRSDQAAVTALRLIASRSIRPDLVTDVTVNDLALWGKVQVGDLVTLRLVRDPSLWYRDAIGYVFSASYNLPGNAGGAKSLKLGVEVYSVTSGGGA